MPSVLVSLQHSSTSSLCWKPIILEIENPDVLLSAEITLVCSTSILRSRNSRFLIDSCSKSQVNDFEDKFSCFYIRSPTQYLNLKNVPAPIKVLRILNRFYIILYWPFVLELYKNHLKGVYDSLNLWKWHKKGRSIWPYKTTWTCNWPITANPFACALSMDTINYSLSYFCMDISTCWSMKAWITLNYCIVLLIVTMTCLLAVVLSVRKEGCSSIH